MTKLEISCLCVCAAVILQFCLVGALQCYECEGGPNSTCAKGIISSMKLVDCPGGSLALCRQTDVSAKNHRRFERGCTFSSSPDSCTVLYRLVIQDPAAMRVYSCNTCSADKCNKHVSLTKRMHYSTFGYKT